MWHSATCVEANISTVSHVSSVQVQDYWIFLDTFWYIWFNIKLRILAFSEGRFSLTLQAASNQPGVSFQEARITFNAGQKPTVESSRKNINQYIGPMAFYLDFSRFWFVVILFMWPCLLGCEVPEVRIRQETENSRLVEDLANADNDDGDFSDKICRYIVYIIYRSRCWWKKQTTRLVGDIANTDNEDGDFNDKICRYIVYMIYRSRCLM